MPKLKYFKQYKEPNATAKEITKEEAFNSLEGYWKQAYLKELFHNDEEFKLWTRFAEIWAQAE